MRLRAAGRQPASGAAYPPRLAGRLGTALTASALILAPGAAAVSTTDASACTSMISLVPAAMSVTSSEAGADSSHAKSGTAAVSKPAFETRIVYSPGFRSGNTVHPLWSLKTVAIDWLPSAISTSAPGTGNLD